MAELSSQYYDSVIADRVRGRHRPRRKLRPALGAHAVCSIPTRSQPVPRRRAPGCSATSISPTPAAPWPCCSEDIGGRDGDGFQLLGRAPAPKNAAARSPPPSGTPHERRRRADTAASASGCGGAPMHRSSAGRRRRATLSHRTCASHQARRARRPSVAHAIVAALADVIDAWLAPDSRWLAQCRDAAARAPPVSRRAMIRAALPTMLAAAARAGARRSRCSARPASGAARR